MQDMDIMTEEELDQAILEIVRGGPLDFSDFEGDFDLVLRRAFLFGLYQVAARCRVDVDMEMERSVYRDWYGVELTDREYWRYCGISIA